MEYSGLCKLTTLRFTHYSRTDHAGKEEDLNKAKSLWTQVSKDSAPGHAYTSKCAPAIDENCKKGR